MIRPLIFIFLSLAYCEAVSQIVQERVRADADRLCYVVGEHLKINVQVNMPDGSPSPSRVAYVEIADTSRLHAQAMLTLDDGRGYAEIPLPPGMHSGTYQLCVYTRGLRNFGESAFFTSPIGVINPTKLSPEDDIRFIPSEDGSITVMFDGTPAFQADIAMVRGEDTPPSQSPTADLSARPPHAYELEGHIVTARVDAADDEIENVRLALVGNTTMIYDGRKAGDGNYEFYTTGIYDDQPSLVSAYSHDGRSLPTSLVSPYAQILPAHLPQLTVRCSEDALSQRYAEAQCQQAIDRWLHKDTQPRKATFMSSPPIHTYDLDEWASMNTVGEMLTEFIRGVYVSRNNGVPQLYTYSQCPALVLYDGIPVYDVQKFLGYDPRLLKYVQIYDDRYTFGQTYCYGVVSFISRSGRLSNYTLDEGTTFAAYQFPQPTQVQEKTTD